MRARNELPVWVKRRLFPNPSETSPIGGKAVVVGPLSETDEFFRH
jgi:hypothetical protein